MKCQSFSPLAFVAATVAALALYAPSTSAAVLFSDTFDRANSRNIDGSLTGIANNTGTVLGIDGVYTHAFIDPLNNDPNNGIQDGNAADGGGAQIISNTLQLAVGAGTSNAYVNHNFTNASILSDGAFRVSLDVTGYNQTSNQQGGSFAIGMSQTEANSGGDAFGSSGGAYQAAFNGTNSAVSDFWVGLRGNGTVAWGGGGVSPTVSVVAVGSKTGTISANFGVSSFNAGSSVNYEIFYNGGSIGVGSFQWSETNANYIGLDARDNTAVSLDNFLIETSAPPLVPSLTIDRDSGNITLKNDTSQPLSMTVYSITSQDGGFNQSNWSKIQTQGIDVNDTWFTFTDPNSSTDLSEGTLGEYTLGASGSATDSINFGDAWIPSPFEDVAVELRNSAGDAVPMIVKYVGNGGDPIGIADYNFNGMVDDGDWPIIRDNLISDVSALTPFQAYLKGDLNGDGMVDRADFRQFKTLYLADNPGGGLFGVPEPSTVLLLTLGAAIAPFVRRRSVQRTVSAALVVVCLYLAVAQDAKAVNLFSDTFNRPDSRNIDASLAGITNNTGTVLPIDGVYTQPHLDPNNDPGPQDADAVNGGGSQIIGNALQLAVGAGTSNAFVNHNFTNPVITSDGGFMVSLNLLGVASGSTLNEFGGGFAVGMSLAEANSADDAFSGGATPSPVMTSGLNNITTLGLPVDPDVISDFWVVLRANSTLAWGGNTGIVQGLNVGANTGTVSVKFATQGFSAGQSVAYEVFFNSVSQGFGSFIWSEDMANYIGLDARDGTGVTMDNLAVESVTDAAINVLRVKVNTTSGVVSIAGGDVANTLDFYEIHSAGMGLLTGGFTGLAAAPGFPAGNGSGNGWEINGVQSTSRLHESYLQSSSTVAAGASAVSLGTIYNTGLNTQDLQFFYDLPNGTTRMGFVEYVTGTPGDFDVDGDVDGDDFLLWQRNPGIGSLADWEANYGFSPLSAAVSSVPEPSSFVLGLSFLAWFWQRRRN